MFFPLWDASALVKRYAAEAGADTVDVLFALVPRRQMHATIPGYAETFSVLLRKHNRGAIATATFSAAKEKLRRDVVDDPDFTLLSVDDAAVFDGVTLMERYNINASDGAILATFHRYIRSLPPGFATPVLVAADRRLLAAA